MRDDLDPVRALLPGTSVELLERLRAGDRSSVERVLLGPGAGGRQTVIVKRFHRPGEGWIRETAALAALPAEVVPQVIAADRSLGVVVLTDLGDGPTVADALLGRDPAAAAAALRGWADALARLHSVARPRRDEFTAALAERRGELAVPRSRVTAELADAAYALSEHCAVLGVAVPTGALDELRGLAQRLGSSGASSLSPADTCPDDAVLLEGRYRLVDFEGAQWRHVAWDVAYLLVPWPTCWCSWRLPAGAADRAVQAYRSAAAEVLPEVVDAAFERDLDAATVGWALSSVTWFIDAALAADTAHYPDRNSPTRRATVLHRLALAAGSRELPALAALAGALDAELRHRWGDVELALAPAFRPGR